MGIQTTPGAATATEMMRTLPRAAYLAGEHFAREADRIFHREWFAVAREESIPATGDYVHVDVAGESARSRGQDSQRWRCVGSARGHRPPRYYRDC